MVPASVAVCNLNVDECSNQHQHDASSLIEDAIQVEFWQIWEGAITRMWLYMVYTIAMSCARI